VAWAVDCDHAETEVLADGVVLGGFEARAGEAVLVENGGACGGTVLCVAEFSAVREGEGGRGAVVEEVTAWWACGG
jgi:hypothetical protein